MRINVFSKIKELNKKKSERKNQKIKLAKAEIQEIEYEKQLEMNRSLFETLEKIKTKRINNSYKFDVNTKIKEQHMIFHINFNKVLHNKIITTVYGNFDETINLQNIHNNVFIRKTHLDKFEKDTAFYSSLNKNKVYNPDGSVYYGQADESNIDWNDFTVAVFVDDDLVYKERKSL